MDNTYKDLKDIGHNINISEYKNEKRQLSLETCLTIEEEKSNVG